MADSGDGRAYSSQPARAGVSRRDFVALLAGAVAAGSPLARRAMAGPFTAKDFDALVPADKKLSAAWIKSLFDRGTPTVYRGDDLKFIGMPVGGITTGQLYLGGDGKLWHWDIFNTTAGTGDGHYAHPVSPESPVAHGFSLVIHSAGAKGRTLDRKGFRDVSFSGQYPIGTVEYRDADCPAVVTLEAFSPFLPLNADDSSLPATILQFTVRNTSNQPFEADLVGHLENAVGLATGADTGGSRRNRITPVGKSLVLECLAERSAEQGGSPRATIVFEDFEGEDYGKWKVEGTAFGKGPAKGPAAPEQHLANFQGKSLANSWPGSDEPKGKLTSPQFVIERNYINFLIGGGDHPQETCINLLLDGKVARTSTGKNTDAMEWASWNVRDLAGKNAVIEIVDRASGDWGHIDLDQIEFADTPRSTAHSFDDAPDYGTLSLALLDAANTDAGMPAVTVSGDGTVTATPKDSAPMGTRLTGALVRKLTVPAGGSATAAFVLAWHFPNLRLRGVRGETGRHYALRFGTATQVVGYVAANFERLASSTRLWRDTWYDSSLPYWFLDRTFLNTSILATSTAFRFTNGRFYGWEGVGCCEGTCTHVWHYQHATGRLFPELERSLREQADFNPDVAFKPDGMIDHRGEFNAGQAVDGQAGIILRAYRDHQMSADDTFLRRIYPSMKRAMYWLIAQDSLDGEDDGILRGAQHNTLDAEWYGPVAWLSGLYLAALRAADAMATEMGDEEFARQCRDIFAVGQKKFVQTLFDGEYFINKPDPKHLDAINSGTGCEIDQVFGQSWAFQVALGRVLPVEQTVTALRSLWRYNFSPDVGPYRKANKAGRWYAMPGEAGLLMCTFPRADWQYEQARGKGPEWATGYFNECMNGFEHQVAGHMIWEGMVQEGLAVERAIHDRYHASRRNPWNEVECGDHYARSMASYGVFLAACGYEYHGPRGYLAFAPKLSPEDFKCAFTVAQGWGQFSQKMEKGVLNARIDLKQGTLRLTELALLPKGDVLKSVSATSGGRAIDSKARMEEGRVRISFESALNLSPGETLEVQIKME